MLIWQKPRTVLLYRYNHTQSEREKEHNTLIFLHQIARIRQRKETRQPESFQNLGSINFYKAPGTHNEAEKKHFDHFDQ